MREHTDLSEEMIRDLVLMKLEAVGLRGAHRLMPGELSGGMARRVALARALALDPMLVMYDEPFTGLDPIALGVIGQLIRKLNDALGATSIMVTHDIHESLLIVDYIYFLNGGRVVAEGTPDEIRPRRILSCISSSPSRMGLCISIIRHRRCVRNSWLGSGMSRAVELIRQLGHATVERVWRLGFAARFLWVVLLYSGASFRRLPLTLREIYFSGVLSLLIILVSGLFVGWCLVCRAMKSCSASVRPRRWEPGRPVADPRTGAGGGRLFFASRAGSSVTAEIGLMKATEQLKAMDMMAVNPIARVVAPRFWGGVISMPLLAAIFSAMGVLGGWLIGVVFIGVDDGAFWSQMQSSVDFRFDVWNGIVKSFVFGVAVSLIAVFEGYDSVPTAEGVSRAITRTVVTSVLAVLALDFVLTSFMFRGTS
jgi:phospholipid/cholesterol/gamma-HCH transport system permease protein